MGEQSGSPYHLDQVFYKQQYICQWANNQDHLITWIRFFTSSSTFVNGRTIRITLSLGSGFLQAAVHLSMGEQSGSPYHLDQVFYKQQYICQWANNQDHL